ncbi:MAG TPA: hypothetical protein VGH64_01990 [Puia sp.]
MRSQLQKWLQISLFNLMLVAFIGVILRYKIAYALPWVDQKNLLHGHSHFAFAGWISQALMALLVYYLSVTSGENYFIKYRRILYANLITAYGMLLSFPVQGYGLVSILFSTISVFVAYGFSISYWRDLNKISRRWFIHSWFKMALLGNIFSSIGPFSLAYMMASHHLHQKMYLAAVYFFLHFQYNVWFLFSCMGLLIWHLYSYLRSPGVLKKIFFYFAWAAAPTYFLSLLWWPVPGWLFILVVLATFSQLYGWILLVKTILQHTDAMKKIIPWFSGILFLFSAIAFSVKLCLQTGSVIPSLSKLAFGFRPIVIGYLHLVLLGVITMFIIAFTVSEKLIVLNRNSITGIKIFVLGVFFNEGLLMTQGISDLQNAGVPGINRFLLLAAAILFTGMFLIVSGQFLQKDDQNHNSSGISEPAL